MRVMQRPLTVLCYGDSNTFGYDPEHPGTRYEDETLWTSRLAQALGAGFRVLREGLNGRTTAYDRPGCAWKNGYSYLAPCLVTHMPVDIVVFMLGTNDCNIEQHLSAEDIAAGMRRLLEGAVETAREHQGFVPKFVLVAPAPIRPEIAGTPYEGDIDATSVAKSRAIAPLYRALADAFGAAFVDASAGIEVSPIDCEHLTRQGHRDLAERVRKAVLALCS